jgi:hypothetical protein
MTSPFKGGPFYSCSFCSGGSIRTELYIDYQTPDAVAALFDFLLERRSEIEGSFGAPVEWEELPGKKASRIAAYLPHSDVSNVDEHNEYISWFFESGDRLRQALEAPADAWKNWQAGGDTANDSLMSRGLRHATMM